MPSFELVDDKLSFIAQFGFATEKKGTTVSLIRQVHGNTVVPLPTLSSDAPPPAADAIFTTEFNTGIWVFTADCLPVILAAGETLTLVHCGWRGAKQGIVREALSVTGVSAQTLHVIFGPALLVCCFEV